MFVAILRFVIDCHQKSTTARSIQWTFVWCLAHGKILQSYSVLKAQQIFWGVLTRYITLETKQWAVTEYLSKPLSPAIYSKSKISLHRKTQTQFSLLKRSAEPHVLNTLSQIVVLTNTCLNRSLLQRPESFSGTSRFYFYPKSWSNVSKTDNAFLLATWQGKSLGVSVTILLFICGTDYFSRKSENENQLSKLLWAVHLFQLRMSNCFSCNNEFMMHTKAHQTTFTWRKTPGPIFARHYLIQALKLWFDGKSCVSSIETEKIRNRRNLADPRTQFEVFDVFPVIVCEKTFWAR